MTLIPKVLHCFSVLCPSYLLQLHSGSLILDLYWLMRSFIPCLFSFWNVFPGLCVSLFLQLIFLENNLFLECFLVRSLTTGAVREDIHLVSVTFRYSLNQRKWTNRNLLTVENKKQNVRSLHCSRGWVYWWRIIISVISVHQNKTSLSQGFSLQGIWWEWEGWAPPEMKCGCAAAPALSFPAQGSTAKVTSAEWGRQSIPEPSSEGLLLWPPGWAHRDWTPLVLLFLGSELKCVCGKQWWFLPVHTHSVQPLLSPGWSTVCSRTALNALGLNQSLLSPLQIKASQWRRIITSLVFASYY